MFCPNRKAEKVKDLFNSVAKKKEFTFDNREFIKNLGINFENKSVFDAGCGQGVSACYIAGKMKAARTVGIDVSDVSIRNANELKNSLKLNNVFFYTNSIDDYNSDDRFDILLALGVLQYVEDLFYSIDKLCSFMAKDKSCIMIFTMTEPNLMHYLLLIFKTLFSNIPLWLKPVGIKSVAMLISPLTIIMKRFRERELDVSGKRRNLENLVRESLFSPVFNIERSSNIESYLTKKGYEVEIKSYMGIKGLYCVVAKKTV